MSERNFIIGIVGDNFEQRNLIGQALGSPGTKSDMQFYNRLDSQLGQVFCAITPVDYPEKLKPLLQTLSISSIHILVIDLEVGLNATIGETLVGMELFHDLFNTNAIIVISNITSKTEWNLDETKKKIKGILDTTSLKGAEILEIRMKDDYEALKKKIIEIEPENIDPTKESYSKVLIDHTFPVKGIGTVILGLVKKGTIHASQMMELNGYDGPAKKIIIRSIQKHDRDFKEAVVGDRVGLALKGTISHEDISRDNIIVTQGIFKQEKKIKALVHLSNFYKPKSGNIKPGETVQYHALVDLKVSPLKFIEGEELAPGKTGEMVMSFDKSLLHDGTGLKGIIAELNRFENKLRILGYFTQIV